MTIIVFLILEESKPLACLKSCAMHTHNVKNDKTNNVIKLRITGEYYKVCLSKNKKKYMLYSHELVAKYFLDNPDNKSLIYHLDNNKFNNNVNNLSYNKIEKILHNSLDGETWKIIEDYDNYSISNFGGEQAFGLPQIVCYAHS